jgi:hypothetical protein
MFDPLPVLNCMMAALGAREYAVRFYQITISGEALDRALQSMGYNMGW